jgi:hypothetical protein
MECLLVKGVWGGRVLRLKLFQAFFFIMPAAAGLMTQATLVEAAPEECRAKPESSAPMHSHWYYRIDRINQRRCWFLSSGDSRTRHTSSLKRRELAGRSTEPEIEEQSKLDARTVAGPTPRQEAVLPSDEQMLGELAVPEFGSVTSESLVPHKVTPISFVEPRVGEQNLRFGTNFDLVFLCGALATALLVAGGVVQVINRLHRRARAASPKSAPLVRSNHNALSSKSSKLNKLRARLSRSNIPSPRPREMLLFSGLSRTAVERQHRASRLRSPSYLDRK